MTEAESSAGWTPVAAAAPPAAPPAIWADAAGTDLIESVTRLDRAIKERRESDQTFVNWWLYVLLLSWVTFGIYGLFLYFKRINRIDAFSRRKHAYYGALLEWTRRRAAGQGRSDIDGELEDLASALTFAYDRELRPIRAGRSFLLTILTLGIYGLVVLYRENRYWWDAQVVERDFDDRLSQIWMTLGVVRYPFTYNVDQSKRRSYPLYLAASILTIGIWGSVWDYKIHTDPDKLFGEFHSIEDSILQTVRAH
ncbi:MAG: DUF4234 domain-containing protein [Solirubrobacteraceae bacterium]